MRRRCVYTRTRILKRANRVSSFARDGRGHQRMLVLLTIDYTRSLWSFPCLSSLCSHFRHHSQSVRVSAPAPPDLLRIRWLLCTVSEVSLCKFCSQQISPIRYISPTMTGNGNAEYSATIKSRLAPKILLKKVMMVDSLSCPQSAHHLKRDWKERL